MAKTFDDIEVRRPDLARGYLTLLRAQPGRPIAMFAPRRVGKTFFLDHDLAPVARDAGLLPVYADLWLQRSAPLEAINHALEEALDDITVPAGAAGKLAKTAVKKIGALGASPDFGDAPARRTLPHAPQLRLDALVTRLAAAAHAPVLLMLDEIQALGDVSGGDQVIASLRAVLHKRREHVLAVFTGSSQEALASMVASAGAPMYQFAQLLNFPVLGDAFLKDLADHFAKVHRGRKPLLDDLRRVFEKIGFKPALIKDIVKSMSAEGTIDVDEAVTRFLRDDRQVAGWRALLQSLEPIERHVLFVIAKGMPPFGRETLETLASLLADRPTLSKVRTAVERLRRAGILAKPTVGAARIEDSLFAEYLAELDRERLR
ncbi:hypothetical protein [Piscinibacter sp.]|uniref:hypothetical protein n=1 Tax=Piscinibacter sp. TaxID=1903157 RepID=UPI002B935142|nr:hypothetical protein [Albitalea sp.]HUG24248.1 hypothetical protein [Albitalea sp.]